MNHHKAVSFQAFAGALLIIAVTEVGHTALRIRTQGYVLELIGCIRFVQIISLLAMVSSLEKELSSVGLNLEGMKQGIIKGLMWSIGFGAVVLLIFGVMLAAGVNLFKMIRVPLPESLEQRVVFIAVVGVIGPAAEELVFRGILYGFCKRWGIGAATVISITAFAMFHNTGHFPATQVIGGLLFTLSYEREKHLMTPMVIHMSGNMAMAGVTAWGI